MKKETELFVVVTEWDTDGPFKSHGAIISETYTKHATLEEAITKAEQLNGRYGQAYIFRCAPVGTVEEVKFARQFNIDIGF